MKKIIFSLFTAAAVLGGCQKSAESQVTGQKSEFYVRGNCEMCKERIEKSASAVEGVQQAEWNVKTSMMAVVFDAEKADEMAIHRAVAALGHGTAHVQMDQKAHDALPECCKMKENQGGEDHSGHNHN